jgi:5-methylcytosine-specific restriction endonuclease McrA
VTWLKVCDTALTHPKVLAIRGLKDASATAEGVVGTVMLAASWSGAHDTDHFIPEAAVFLASPLHHELMSDVARRVGLWRRATAAERKRNLDQPGWIVKVGDGEVFHLLTREQIATRSAHRKLSRSVQGRIDLFLRDGDQCRYCAVAVEPNDRRSHAGRTTDHPDPAVPDDIVIACRGCNLSKNKRTVTDWVAAGGRDLMPPPAERGDPLYLDSATREWLLTYVPADDPRLPAARPDSQSDTAAASRDAAAQARPQQPAPSSPTAASQQPTRQPPPTRPDPNPIPAAVAGHAAPGRVGTGRDGSSSHSSGDPPTRTRRRTRGSRGKRGGSAPPS